MNKSTTLLTPKYIITEDLDKVGGWNILIDGDTIDDDVFNTEAVNYRFLNRKELIVDIQGWMCEARQSHRNTDAQLMDNDIDYLKTLDDEYVFSSILTNEYVAFSNNPTKFDDICEDILEANKSWPRA